jgi:hypothetical protein
MTGIAGRTSARPVWRVQQREYIDSIGRAGPPDIPTVSCKYRRTPCC